ncbi:MAG: hypothetical protein HC797_07890 [Anaerolineales bacterium]|nr:hypothetical protein [Anaerolineales bacterium]
MCTAQTNFLHLNLAPELIHINQRGEIFLSGIANATLLGDKTSLKLYEYPPLYISPEEINQKTPSPASDVYSLAVLLYQLVTNKWINGKQQPKTNDAIYKAHLESNPPAPISLNKKSPIISRV